MGSHDSLVSHITVSTESKLYAHSHASRRGAIREARERQATDGKQRGSRRRRGPGTFIAALWLFSLVHGDYNQR